MQRHSLTGRGTQPWYRTQRSKEERLMKLSPEAFEDEIIRTIGRAYFDRRPLWQVYLQHHLTREGARVYAMEHSAFADRFPSWFGKIIANCPYIEARAY